MPLDHISIFTPKAKVEDMVTFLTSSLEHLGFKVLHRPAPNVVGMGDATAYFWIGGLDLEEEGDVKNRQSSSRPTHVAFSAESTDQVDQFHAAALKAGGTCNGPPGLRLHYGPTYYGAFVIDPICGLNVEVVHHRYSE